MQKRFADDVRAEDNLWESMLTCHLAATKPEHLLFMPCNSLYFGRTEHSKTNPMDVAKEALRLAAQKLPVKTKFVVARDYDAA